MRHQGSRTTMTRGLPACATAFAIALGLVGPVRAVTVKNATTNTLLFHADFEADGAGANPATAVPGSWGVADYLGADIQVLDAASPGPAQGAHYLVVPRATGGTYAVGSLLAAQSTPGDVIHFEAMIYLPSLNAAGAPNPVFAMQTFFRDGDPVIVENGSISGGTGDILYYSSGHQASGLKYTADKWQKWEIDFAIGASTFSLAIDGQSVTGLPTNGAIGTIDRFYFGNGNANGVYYVDAVPEPATLAIFGLGGLIFAARRRLAA